MQLRWSHAVVYVRDMEPMLDFYTKVLGFEITDRGPVGPEDGPEIVFMSQVPSDHHQLAFLSVRKDNDPPNSVNHFAFRVDSIDDVRAMTGRLTDDGRAGNLNPMTHGNAWSIYFSDPEGNGLEVFCDTPWHVQQPQGRPWDMSKNNEEVTAETHEAFAAEPGFEPIADFYKAHAEHLRKR